MDSLLSDLRFAFRTATKTPGSTAIIVLTVALGIGANTAIFSVVDAVLLADLPYRQPNTLVRITGELRGSGLPDIGVSIPELDDYRVRPEIFSEIAGIYPITANVTGGDRPERVETLLVSGNYFTLLGVQAQMGRVFDARDETPGITEIAVISDGLWRRRFGGDPAIVGRKVRLDEDNYTIVGVMPPGFRHPGRTVATDVEFWAPSGYRAAPFRAPSRSAYFLDGALARLAPGLTFEQAQARLDALARELRRQYPTDYLETRDWRPRLVPLKEDLTGNVKPALLTLFAAVAMVLLIGCVNVANLLLARASGRQREMAIRRALGAGRARLIRQMITESVLLAMCSGLVACLVTLWTVDALVTLTPASVPRLHEVAPNARVLLFALGISLLTGLLFGLAPALQSANPPLQEKLKEGSHASTAAPQHRVRRTLVVVEFALALVLLAGAGLLIRSFARLMHVDLGFQAEHMLVARLWLPQPNDPATGPYFEHQQRLRFIDEVLRRVKVLPGVEVAAMATNSPLEGGRANVPFTPENPQASSTDVSVADVAFTSGDYFEALRIPLIRGHFLSDKDTTDVPPVVVVNEALARRYWPGADPIGKRLKFGGIRSSNPWMTIVGVVRDVKTSSLEAANRPQIYRSLQQASSLALTLILRGAIDPAGLGEAVRHEVAATDARIPVYGVNTMEQLVDRAAAQRRFAAFLLGVFAGLALLLSAIGIYGVMAYSVAQRTQEIGIRMALGASRRDVHRLIIGQGLAMSAAGIAFGVLLAFAVTRLMSRLLFGITPRDPLTFTIVPAVLALVAVAACYLPARRAAAVEPIRALRYE